MSIQCTVPQCRVKGAPEHMWLPEWQAVRRANGGKPVATADLPRYALCGKHGRMLRESGVRAFRYSSCVASATEMESRQAAERTHFAAFAQQFTVKSGDELRKAAGVRFAERGDRRGVVQPGQGLSRFKGQRRAEVSDVASLAEKPTVAVTRGANGATAHAEPVPATP